MFNKRNEINRNKRIKYELTKGISKFNYTPQIKFNTYDMEITLHPLSQAPPGKSIRLTLPIMEASEIISTLRNKYPQLFL